MVVTEFLYVYRQNSQANKYNFATFHFEYAKNSAGTMMVGSFYSLIFTKLGISLLGPVLNQKNIMKILQQCGRVLVTFIIYCIPDN
jgi:hypothetical protein